MACPPDPAEGLCLHPVEVDQLAGSRYLFDGSIGK
jgi:hypothetical protein